VLGGGGDLELESALDAMILRKEKSESSPEGTRKDGCPKRSNSVGCMAVAFAAQKRTLGGKEAGSRRAHNSARKVKELAS